MEKKVGSKLFKLVNRVLARNLRGKVLIGIGTNVIIASINLVAMLNIIQFSDLLYSSPILATLILSLLGGILVLTFGGAVRLATQLPTIFG